MAQASVLPGATVALIKEPILHKLKIKDAPVESKCSEHEDNSFMPGWGSWESRGALRKEQWIVQEILATVKEH